MTLASPHEPSLRRTPAPFRQLLRGAALACAIGLALAVPAARAADAPPERLQVADPYIELHTGAGRGYPVFHIAEKGEWVEVLLRHTDWFKVRTAKGQEGWVTRAQLEATLTEAGGSKTFRDVLLDDYLRRRVEFGAAWGRFQGEPMLKMWTGYRFSDTLTLEGTIGQVQGRYSGSDFWHANLMVEPWSDKRLSPFFGVGFGKFKNVPNTTLVNAVDTKAKLANAGIGVRYHLTDRFLVRADWSIYTAFIDDTRSTEYRAGTIGFSFFFN